MNGNGVSAGTACTPASPWHPHGAGKGGGKGGGHGAAVSWSATVQQMVTLSTTEAELVALSKATQETIFLRQILERMGATIDWSGPHGVSTSQETFKWDPDLPTVVYCDNRATVLIVTGDGASKRLRHVAVREFFVREKHAEGVVQVLKVPTLDNYADGFTKMLPLAIVRRHRFHIHGQGQVVSDQ